tara:strand:- start:1607 stop:2701 length:1095 start_codon:yes stop_codon:yes gene_type:complete
MKPKEPRMEGLELRVIRHPLEFVQPARTSRDVLTTKPTFFLVAQHPDGRRGCGECSLIPGLSPESEEIALRALQEVVKSGTLDPVSVSAQCPAVRFAVEMALMDLEGGGAQLLLDNDFARGQESIKINGLIWMNSPEHMMQQAAQLIHHGFKTLKMKIGVLPFVEELVWLEAVRSLAPQSEGFTLRVDANGAFSKSDDDWKPLQKLEKLAHLGVHSIEQPLLASDRKGLAKLCAESPLPIALDESLIGVFGEERHRLLEALQPQFLVLKPSLIGGLAAAGEWLTLAESLGVNWWATSALESNVGLNAIAQWTAGQLEHATSPLPQGLGTGGLFTNNVDSPLVIEGEYLSIKPSTPWVWPNSFEQ